MTPGFRKFSAREARRLQAQIRRETIRDLRARIRDARARRRQTLKQVRHHCRAARCRLRDRIKALKLQAREKLRAEIAAMRAQAREQCKSRVARVRELGGTKIQIERAALRHQQALNAEIARTEGRMRKAHARSEKEQREESDDEVRGNLPPELLAVFERVKRSIRGNRRLSRTEAFLHWAEENPDEVVSIQMMDADVATERMIRELQELERQHARGAAA